MEWQLFLVAFGDLSESPHYNKVHAVQELVALSHHTQAYYLSQPIHLVTSYCIVDDGVAGDHTPQEKHEEVAELGDLVRAAVTQADVLEHDAHVHGRVGDFGDEETGDDEVGALAEAQGVDHAADAE